MYRSIKVYASDNSSPIFTSILGFAVAAFASLSASSFPLMPMWLGSHTKSTFLVYLLTRPITCSSRLGLQLLLPDAIACSELYESLNILTFLSDLLITHWRANFMAHKRQQIIISGKFVIDKSVFSFLRRFKHDTAGICCWQPCCCGYGSQGGQTATPADAPRSGQVLEFNVA